MMAEVIDRKQLKARVRETLRTAQVPPKAMTALYMGLSLVLSMVDVLAGGGLAGVAGGSPLGTFVSVLTSLLGLVLSAGFLLYCMAVLQGQRAEFLTLFDGFSFVGKIIGLYIVEYFFIFLWTLLFVVPGLIAGYRYRFAIYNLCQDPEMGIFEALDMSKKQTQGYKAQLFLLDLSYFGWFLLATLPAGYEGYYIGLGQPMPIPLPLYILVLCMWQLVVYLFFLPAFQCTVLGYFETAKRTSGVGVHLEEPPRLDENSSGGNTPFDL